MLGMAIVRDIISLSQNHFSYTSVMPIAFHLRLYMAMLLLAIKVSVIMHRYIYY